MSDLNVQIATTLEYLGPYAKGKKPFWGASISVGVDGEGTVSDLGLVKSLLRPWLWTAVGFTLFRTDKDAKPIEISTEAPALVASRDTSVLKSGLEEAFERTLKADASFTKNLFQWVPKDQPDVSSIHPTLRQPPWPAVLAQFSQLPYPIPHTLNLCWFFQAELPSGATEQYIIALPTFTIGKTKFVFDDDAPVSSVSNANVALARKYASSEVFAAAYCNPLVLAQIANPAARKDPDNCLSQNDPYVPVRAIFDKDWISHLPARAAEAFDLAQRMIDAIRAVSSDPASKSDLLQSLVEAIPQIRDVIVGCLYCLADVGVDPGPDGGSIFKQIATGFTGDLSSLNATLKKYQDSQQGSTKAIREIFSCVREIRDLPAIDPRSASKAPAPVFPGGRSEQQAGDIGSLRLVLSKEVQQLDVLQSVLTGQDALTTLLLSQWDEALKGVAATDAATRDEFILRAKLKISGVQLRRQYAMGNLGRYWASVVRLDKGEQDERTKLRSNFVTVMQSAISARLSTVASKPAGKAVIDWTTEWAKSFAVNQLLPEDEASPTPVKSGGSQQAAKNKATASQAISSFDNTPHGISVQADCLFTFPGSDDQSDVARQTSGFFVLMRDRSQGGEKATWRSLNHARAQFSILKKDGNVVMVEWDDPVLVPFPIQDEGLIRKALITYNNNPLLCISPAVKFGAGANSQGDDSVRSLPPLVQYGNAYSQGNNDWLKLPPLIYGRSYDFLLGRMRNSSALPREVANPDMPGELIESARLKVDRLPTNYIGTAQYLRRVPVGALRAAPATGKRFNDRLQWGAPLKGIQPRVLEVVPKTGDLYSAAGMSAPKPNSDPNSSLPILLLNGRQETFTLYPPTTDINTWDRWVAGPKSLTDLRKQVWATVHRNASRKSEASKEADALMLEDPAVAPVVVAELVTDGSAKRVSTSWQRVTNPQSLDDLRTPGVAIQVLHAPKEEPEAIKLTIEHGQIVVSVREGTIAYLYLYCTIEAKARDRFFPGVILGKSLDGIAIHAYDQPKEPDWKSLYLLPPFSVAIETVSRDLPSVEEIRNALDVSYTDDRLQVSLTRDAKSASFLNVSKVEILRQKWRWDGRPFWDDHGKVMRFPINAFEAKDKGKPSSDPPSQTVQNWELQAFGPRTDYEVLSTRLKINGAEVRFERSDDISSEPAATYFRFAARVWNRYAPLLESPTDQSLDSSRVGPDLLNEWKRLFVPCRWATSVPPPHIELILPLTESAPDDAKDYGVSGLLVVIEGPWYTVGGLTEDLTCSIATTKDPTTPLANSVQEIGPDPAETAAPADTPGPKDLDGYTLRDMIGPVGHTLDESDSVPLFVKTSFLLPGPNPPTGSASRDLGWFFGKVRFSRRLKKAKADTFNFEEASKPTDAYWVQFLPRFVFETIDNKLIGSSTTVELAIGGGSVTLRNGNDPLVIARSADDDATSRLFGILTESIQDVGGRLQQERFLGLFTYQGTKWNSPDTIVAAESTLLFRIIEVQIPPNNRDLLGATHPQSLRSLWEQLFPLTGNQGPTDSTARVVRVSRPIRSRTVAGSAIQ